MKRIPPQRGRGAAGNPPNRFESLQRQVATDDGEDVPAPRTEWIRDRAKSIIAYNDSPDVGIGASINPYRGCEHGCIYCYARPSHEYLGYSAGLDFESKILVKTDAPALLRAALSKTGYRPQAIALSGNTDAYQPSERKLELTRACLAVLAEFRNPVIVITKSFLVTRDIDYLSALSRCNAAAVIISITTLDAALARAMEPRAAAPRKRLEAIAALTQAGIPTGVNVAPVIPGLTDEEIPAIVQAAKEAGARFAGTQPVRLPHGVKDLFTAWLDDYLPQQKKKILNRIQSMRGNKLNDSRFGTRMRGEGEFARQIAALFDSACRKSGIPTNTIPLSTDHFRVPATEEQLSLL